MTTVIWLVIGSAALAVLYVALRDRLAAFLTFRGTRIVTCPETKAPAAVEVDATGAALTARRREPRLRLRECSRWPGRRGCGQACLAQIRSAPADCLVRTIVTSWYRGKRCVLCGRSLDEIEWLEHRPALMSPEGRTVQWVDVPAEHLPRLLATFRPVCWSCHIAETFRREHPGLVVDRPWRSGHPRPAAP
jgi:hypothetical protein